MTIHEVDPTSELAKQIQACSQEQFTGQLDITITPVLHLWSLYFRQGSLIGCTSSVHPIRSWCRQVSMYCPELPVYSIQLVSNRPVYWDYNCLVELVQNGKIQRQQMAAVVAGHIIEILFDIQQQSEQLRHSSTKQLTYNRVPKDTIDSKAPMLVLISSQHLWQQATQAWEAWRKAGLADYSPNLAPVVRQPKQLRQQISAVAYQNLISLADGNWTLRDLALKLKQNLLPLTQSIIPYIHQGFIGMIDIEDYKEPFKPHISTYTQTPPAPVPPPVNPVQPQPQPSSPLVACIDDNYNDSQKMNHILTQAGYRFINIQDPVKALMILLENKPDLIFLDLVMPIANGYEICSQIRRVSALKDTPVIILTNNDRIVDRVRAKMVGSSGFLGKPIDAEKVLSVVRKYVAAKTPAPSQRPQTLQALSTDNQV